MAIGIYKPGQGYWVRVLTATLIGVVTLAAAAWSYSQMQLVAEKLPRSVWAIPFSQAGGVPSPGQLVTLIGKTVDATPGPEIGTATVVSYSVGASELRIAIDQYHGCIHHTVSASMLSYSACVPKNRIAKAPAWYCTRATNR